jgi:hypothetical protein
MDEDTTPSEATREEDRLDAERAHQPDRAPTAEEEAAADRTRDEHAGEEADVARHHREMDQLGAHAKGEGRID